MWIKSAFGGLRIGCGPGFESGLDETGCVEAVETAEPRIGMGEMRGQGADVAVRGENFVQSRHFIPPDRRTAQARTSRR